MLLIASSTMSLFIVVLALHGYIPHKTHFYSKWNISIQQQPSLAKFQIIENSSIQLVLGSVTFLLIFLGTFQKRILHNLDNFFSPKSAQKNTRKVCTGPWVCIDRCLCKLGLDTIRTLFSQTKTHREKSTRGRVDRQLQLLAVPAAVSRAETGTRVGQHKAETPVWTDTEMPSSR